ncbi:zinc finger protein 521-like [Cyprinus carpio]|uniref:Zinc finger protein 521-like n=1 Tax=Cyprinus carpio TaxID=7962 RepID=A0A9Q9X892_CYPCA|nr:zinc finger protein 521-like [Cyprinus carpio]XP_042596916.1 zinc finger protein 521-like [Cyprinus carpio]
MLGLQETMSTGSPKTYSCVACSATFHNLASLLVHQASHASDISPQPDSALPTCVSCGSLFASKDLLEKHHCAMSPTQASPVHTYICDCGEEFSELTALEHHKKQHGSEDKVKSDLESIPVVPDSKTDSSRPVSDQVFHSLSPSPSNEKPLAKSPPTSNTDIKENKSNESADMDSNKSADMNGNESADMDGNESDGMNKSNESADMDSNKSADMNGNKFADMDSNESADMDGNESADMDSNILKPSESHPVVEEQVQLPEQDSDALITSKVVNHSVQDNEKSPESSEDSAAFNKNSILKMLASAYMSHRQPVQMKQRNLPPRKASPRAPMQPAITLTIPKPKPLENQSKIKKDNTVVGVKTAKMLPKKSKIISVTQTLCPVVVLETRQKLFGRDNVEGRHQCRLCRRVFQDVDTLIMHHALHKKERVKFCLCCQQFVITVISVPESHVCYDGFSRKHEPLMGKMSLKPVSPTAQQAEKMFYCSLCKRGYTRMRSLKKHNCPCKASLKLLTTVGTSGNVKLQNLEECNRAVLNSKTNQMSTQHIDIGVGTESIKIEEQNTEFPIGKKDQTGLKMQLKDQLNPPKTLESVFASVSNSKPTKNSVEVPANIVEVKQEETDKLVEKQWTMPLEDAEIDVLIDVDQKDSDEDDLTDVVGDDCDEAEDVVIVEPHEDKEMKSALPSNGFQVHVTNKGLKRFVCNGCQRSYSRLFTLKEHLRMCEARELKQQNFTSSNTAGPIKRFPCPQCGKFFSRKDNMNMHRKKCHPATNNDSVVSNRTVEPKTPVSQENLFVLSPSTENQAVRQESTPNTSSNRNWGIMSLPSVLPRRVTCECGASFTCPRLLFEHLQQHAQESYICPHCGESLQSWMDFEAHQQLHQSQSSPSEQRAAQQQPHSFSHALPSRALTRPQQSPGFSERNIKAQLPGLLAPQHLNNRPFPEALTCHKCKKNFSLRRNLLRHIRLRCTGETAGQKKHTCSRCGTTFQSPLMLKVHIQSNTCKPAFKPIRCPVCVRWFSCLDGLKRHLVSHSRQSVLTCQICDQNFPTPQALEEHKRNVHRLNSGMRPAEDAQQQLHQAGAQTSPSTPFQCHICLRYYPKLQSLKDHLRKVHRPKQPKQTNRSTVDPVRSGPFQCQICDRSYPNIKSLKNHRRRVHHIVGGVFLPSKGTEQNITLSQFQCHICPCSYPDEQSLRNHRRRVHHIVEGHELSRGVTQHHLYKCQICQRSYPDAVSLRNHRRRVHRILGPVPETPPPPTQSQPPTTNNDTEDVLEEKPIPFL